MASDLLNTIVQDAVSWMLDTLKDTAGQTITITRGQQVTESIVAVPTIVKYDVMDDEGFMTKTVSMDWRVATADLVLDGETFEPREGDIVTGTTNNTTIEWRVMPVNGRMAGHPASEWEDPAGLLTIIHTRRKS